MIKFFLFTVGVFFLLSCQKASTNMLEGMSLPEGAVIRGEYVYISNVGVEFKPLEKDSDGFISRMKSDGSELELKFLPLDDTMHSPKGMAIVNNVLYVTDIDVLKGYDLATRKKVFSLDFSSEKTLLLNDLTTGPGNSLFVSAMDINKIFRVQLDSPSYSLIYELPKPNGLYWSEALETLFVGQFGREDNCNGGRGDIGKIQFVNDTAVYSALSSYQGNIDGVEVYNDTLYFTNWLSHGEGKGSFHALSLKSGTIREVSALEVNGAGDFTINYSTRTLYLPRMRENKVEIRKF